MNRITELVGMSSVGSVFVVKNQDGSTYFVDHGYSGELIKRNGRWEDKKYGFDTQNVFWPARCNYDDLVSWEDKEPFDIDRYIDEKGIRRFYNGEANR